jgi:hypothetical protein
LPVVTRVVSPQDGSIRVTSRYAFNGQIISKTIDGDGNLVQLRISYGQSDGSTITRTEYPDESWRQVRTRGESDGTVTRETTSGFPSLGSGMAAPGSTPKPMLASGVCVSPTPPRPTLASGVTVVPKPPVLRFASGITSVPKPPILRPGPNILLRLFCSGMQVTPPRPILT